jgi:oligopeptide transport system substrate-binding protein
LRDNLKFSDGSRITANDFIYTYRRVVDPKTASGHNYLLAGVVNGNKIIKGELPPTSLGISAPDAQTVVIQLDHPDANFLNYLTLGTVGVVSQKTINKYASAWTQAQNMVTSGAYVLSEHVVNGHILLTKNPYYFQESQVAIAKVDFFPYVDHNAGLSAYKTGGLDLVYQSVPIDQYQNLKQQYPSELHTIQQEGIYFYDLNQLLPQFKNNPELRQALSMAIDRNALVNKVLGQGETALYSNVTSTVESGAYKSVRYSWADLPYDEQVKIAQQLYAKAGYSASHPLKIDLSYNTDDLHKKIALAIAGMWKSTLGVEVTLSNQEWKTFIASRHSGNYVVARDRWVADYNSVTSYTQLYLCNGMQNNSHYCNPAYDKLVTAAENSSDLTQQQQLYRQALTLALNDYAIIPLFQPNYSKLVKPYVSNLDVEHNFFNVEQSKWVKFSD